MKKNSTLSGILTYVAIVFIIVVINILLCIPIKNIEKNSANLKVNFENTIKQSQVSEEVKSSYNEYLESIKNEYSLLGRNYTNMVVALLAVVSLGLVVFGLVYRVNSNRNKGIYNAVILAGITTIFYLMYFAVNFSNTFEKLF